MPIFDPTQGGTPQINQPYLSAVNVNGNWEVQLNKWVGNLPSGYQIVNPQQGQSMIQESVSRLQSKLQEWGPTSKTGQAVQRELDMRTKAASEVGTLSGAFNPASMGGANYVIGPNGNLMTAETAANFVPSPQETAMGIVGTGQYAGMSAAEVDAQNTPTLPKAPVGSLLGATVGVSAPTTQLKRGDTGAGVKQLQDWLVANKYMTQAQVDTGYGTFGPQTEKAVTAMQVALGVDNKTGPGVYGPRTIAKATAVGGGGTSGGDTTGGGGVSNAELDTILKNPSLSADQRAAIQAIFGAVQSNDADTATKIQAAMKAASEFSDPYFKAQIRLATDALNRGISGKEGDLAFAESEKKAALEELKANTAASKDQLSFEHAQELQNLARKYETDIATTQDNLAASGFTSSSKRARAEQILGEQNTGLVESSNKQYGYQTGALDRTLASGDASTQAALANLQRLTTEGKLDLFRQAEQEIGSANLPAVNGLTPVGGVGGTIPRQSALDQLQFASNFVF